MRVRMGVWLGDLVSVLVAVVVVVDVRVLVFQRLVHVHVLVTGSQEDRDPAGHDGDLPAGRFPCVKLRGPAAFIALSSAVPRPPFVSAGYVSRAQLDALRAALAHPEVARRLAVVLIHHDPIDSRLRLEQLRSGLVDASALRSALSNLARGLVLFGHLHVRRRSRLTTAAGTLEVICASGAGLDHRDERVRAGFNLYAIQDDGEVSSGEAWVLDPATLEFERRELPAA